MSRSMMLYVLVVALLAGCSSAGAGDEGRSEPVEPAGTSTEDDATGLPAADPVEEWLAEAAELLAGGDADGVTSFLHASMHPALRSEFRWCDTTWWGKAGISWGEPATLQGEDDPADGPWEGQEGPLAGEEFPDAQRLDLDVTTAGTTSRVTMPFVVEGQQLLWLADCPPQPEVGQEPTPEAVAEEAPAERAPAGVATTEPSGGDRQPTTHAPEPSRTGARSGVLDGQLMIGGSLVDAEARARECHSIRDKDVLIKDGSGATVALGTIDHANPRQLRYELTDHSLIWRCAWTYTVDALPSEGILTFEVRPRSSMEGEPNAFERVNAAALGDRLPELRWHEAVY
jgi:hypothetical protein